MKTPSIAIFTGSHLCHNPRVIKEASTLAAAGYKVEVLGGWFDEDLKARDQELLSRLKIKFLPVLDLVENNGSRRLIARMHRKLGELAHTKGGWENTRQLGLFMPALEKAACNTKADLLIAHSEQSMAAIALAADRNGARIGLDMEDWFSQDGTDEIQRRRPVQLLKALERSLMGSAAHRSCTSYAMSQAISAEFDCSPPVVIYNAFEWAERQLLDGQVRDRKDLRLPSVHWYSQTIGESRGLEDLFGALRYVEREIEIHLRGRVAAGFEKWLSQMVSPTWRSRIFIHGLVSNDELLSRISEHDIGFAGEGKYCRNKALTVSNKILQYLLAGLAVIASDTPGQCEVAERASGAVSIYKSGSPQELANQLNVLLGSTERLQTAKMAALLAAETTFCWERQSPVLLQSIETALAA